jgi:14-3-3 protein epsilon
VKTRRDAWRTIQAIQHKEELKGNKFLPLIHTYKDKIETELKDICHDVLDLLETSLLPTSKNPEAVVFF